MYISGGFYKMMQLIYDQNFTSNHINHLMFEKLPSRYYKISWSRYQVNLQFLETLHLPYFEMFSLTREVHKF